MKNFRKLTEGLPTKPLLDIISAHPEWWIDHQLRQSYPGSAHHATQSIILNGTKEKFDLDKIFNDLTTEPYPHMVECKDALYEILNEVLIEVPEIDSFGRIIIAKLPAFRSVASHIDEGKYAESSKRLHVPLSTNGGCKLCSGDEYEHFGVGELWWFNHRIEHAAFNDGDTDRIHLIIDVRGDL